MNYGFHVEAERELIEAIAYYAQIDLRLAANFLAEIEEGIQAIRRHPRTWRIVQDEVRRYLVHRFPHAIYYTVQNDFISSGQIPRRLRRAVS